MKRKMKIEDKKLFLKYSLPCSKTLLKRGTVSGKTIKEFEDFVFFDKRIEKNPADVFLVASSMCSLIAKKLGKPGIDSEVIRNYFWNEHDEVIAKRFEEMGDFDPEECRVYPGKILKIGKIVFVLTPIGIRAYKKTFEKNLKADDYVTLHYDFVVENISKAEAKNLWTKKKKYVKNFVGFK